MIKTYKELNKTYQDLYTNVNTWHYERLEDTIKQLTEALKERGYFYYQSSW